MLIFGHVGFSHAIALILDHIAHRVHQHHESDRGDAAKHALGKNEEPRSVINYQLFLVAIFLPDLFDKTISQLIAHSGRAYGHTLLFVALATVIAFVLTKGDKQVAMTVLVGCIIHLILDLDGGGFVPFFWPFIPYMFPRSEPWTLERLITVYMTSPPLSEVIGLFLTAIIVMLKKDALLQHVREDNVVTRRFFAKRSPLRLDDD